MSSIEHGQDPIPVIDISNPSEAIAQQVLDAASKHGFLYIKNDGVTIPPQDIDDMFKIVGPTITSPNKQPELTISEQTILRLPQGAESRIRNPLRQSRRHKPRLGIHAR